MPQSWGVGRRCPIGTGTLKRLCDRKKFGNLGGRTGLLSQFPGILGMAFAAPGRQAGRTAAGNGARELQFL